MAFTQVLIFVVVGAISIYLSDLRDIVKKFNVKFTDVTMHLLIVGVICFIIGIISYTILGTILGSLATRIEDMNQALMPMTAVSFIAFYIALLNLNTPETMLTKLQVSFHYFLLLCYSCVLQHQNCSYGKLLSVYCCHLL